ncbi:hypothetical protein M2323_002979 [Rhodoblastus acidophilus]|uniref:hypothetical protein n=1 Tax=Rhodoblastus acidophilus TaxID=1074 RepID=UPI00178D58A0|nr:hypothetical protein [Rhodoblastus acidophilus]MCW2285101.1 hypothetical protein [Rhodoblastus acidophilus]MCW2334041.1 hypothetical protein [Rhodoblastus acidophilus]
MLKPSSGLKIGVALLVALAFTAPASANLRQQRDQMRQRTDDCERDARRLCHAHIPNVDAITACMQRHVKQLSPACRRHFHHH